MRSLWTTVPGRNRRVLDSASAPEPAPGPGEYGPVLTGAACVHGSPGSVQNSCSHFAEWNHYCVEKLLSQQTLINGLTKGSG